MLSLTQISYIIELEMMSRTFFQKEMLPWLSGTINSYLFKNVWLMLYYPCEGQMKKPFCQGTKNLYLAARNRPHQTSIFSFKNNSLHQQKEEK